MNNHRYKVVILAALVSFLSCLAVLRIASKDTLTFSPQHIDLTNERILEGTVIPIQSVLAIGAENVQLTSVAHSCSCLSVSSPVVDFAKLPVALRANSQIPIRVDFNTTAKMGIHEQGVTFSFEVGDEASVVRRSLSAVANIRAPMQPCPPHVVLNSRDSTALVRICEEDVEPLYAVEAISYEAPITAKLVEPSPMHITFAGNRLRVRNNIEVRLAANDSQVDSTTLVVKLRPLDDRFEPKTIRIPVGIKGLQSIRSIPSKLFVSSSGQLVTRDVVVTGPRNFANCTIVSYPDFCTVRPKQEYEREGEKMFRFEVTGSIGSGEIVFRVGQKNLVLPVKFLKLEKS